jgi:hypothetical protein
VIKRRTQLCPAEAVSLLAPTETVARVNHGEHCPRRLRVTRVAVVTEVLKLKLDDINEATVIDRVLILSLMPSLYTARLEINDETYVLTEKGTSIRRPSAEALKRALSRAQVSEYRMIHSSAYDEMIGQGIKVENQMDVPA